jgi:hypothetical protein
MDLTDRPIDRKAGEHENIDTNSRIASPDPKSWQKERLP